MAFAMLQAGGFQVIRPDAGQSHSRAMPMACSSARLKIEQAVRKAMSAGSGTLSGPIAIGDTGVNCVRRLPSR